MPAWPDGTSPVEPRPARTRPRDLVLRSLKSFGHFWWDFLVGDTPELFVAVLIIVGITALLAASVSTVAAWVTMPILVVGALAVSVLRGRRTG